MTILIIVGMIWKVLIRTVLSRKVLSGEVLMTLTTTPTERSIKTARNIFDYGYKPETTLLIGLNKATEFSIFQGSLVQESQH